MQKTLQVDPNITLEIPTLEDAEELFSVVDTNREHLRTFLIWVDKTTTVEHSRLNIQARIDKFTEGSALPYIIKFQGKIVGSADFIKISNTHRHAEIGYWISKDHEGKGIVSKCVKALIEYGFKELQLHRILIRCDSRNTKSEAIPKRLGFTHEGTFREDFFDGKEYSNAELYGLLAGEF